MSSLVFAGIDVSQARLDVAVNDGQKWSLPHDESGDDHLG